MKKIRKYVPVNPLHISLQQQNISNQAINYNEISGKSKNIPENIRKISQ